MKPIFGVCIPNFGNNLSTESVSTIASEAEEMEYESVWVTDHLLLPVSQKYPYGNIFETLSTMSFIAGITERVKIGSSVIVLPMRETVQVAKSLATIDVLSKGRVIAGFAAGWCREEFENLGMNFRNRGKRLDESLKLIKTLWRGGEIVFEGKYYNIKSGIFEPTPTQPGGPPIWLGGNSEAALQRALRLGDGWHFTGIPLNQLVERLEGKTLPETFVISGRLTVDFTGKSPRLVKIRTGEERAIVSGGIDQVIEQLGQYIDRGVTHFAIYFGDKPAQRYLTDMEIFSKEVIPTYV
ncbi:MAG: TIGR03619 family F420-dependent LLM class oxidoreductase [Candidatus Caldarchaeum sp.]|nr:TIGR03619 family F420-dependent LLM class oxidoreductase [Candidatus Caldarchaeum sp.]